MPNIEKNTSGLRRLPRATLCSLKGYKAAWTYESGFRQYTVVSLLLFPIAYFVTNSVEHFFILMGVLIFVLFAEIVNSAVEALADAVMPEYNELVGRAKDLGSAAVFTALMFAILVWMHALYVYFT